MSVVINLYGGPGTGKSTTAAGLFSEMKQAGVNAELLQEYVKQWAWEKRVPVAYDQFYIFGKQARKEYTLFDKVDAIVTDCPVSMCAFYGWMYGGTQQANLFKDMVKTYYSMVGQNHKYVHVWLNRVKAYNPKGRFQTEEEARAIDVNMKAYLESECGIEFVSMDADTGVVPKLMDLLSGVSGIERGETT